MTTLDTARASLAMNLAEAAIAVADAPVKESTVQAVTDRLSHALGVAIASTRMGPFRTAQKALRGESGGAVVIGSEYRLAPGAAAFLNAVSSHSSLQEDCGPGGFREGSHPSTYIIPAALAAADHSGASGDRLLRGIVAGYETVGRLGASTPVGLSARKFRPVGLMGPFGAAAAASYVLGSDSKTTAASLGFAANVAAGSGQGFISGSMEPYFHAGFAARNGLLSAMLAQSGAPAAAAALEGPHGFFAVYAGEAGNYDAISERLTHPAVTRLGTKKYAACLQNQESLELAGELLSRLGDARPVRVVLRRPDTPENGTGSPGVGEQGPYTTMLQRQMSARFTVAAALLGRHVTDPLYFQDAEGDTDAAALADHVTLEQSRSGDVELLVELDDGTTHTTTGRRPELLRPASSTFGPLFLERAATVLGVDGARVALDRIVGLRHLEVARLLTSALAPRT